MSILDMLYVLDEHGEPRLAKTEDDYISCVLRRIAGRRAGKDPWRVADCNVGRSWVSTAFLGTEHCSGYWETMVFGGALDYEQWRCRGSRADAQAMHCKAVQLVTAREGRLRVTFYHWRRAWLTPFLDDQFYDLR